MIFNLLTAKTKSIHARFYSFFLYFVKNAQEFDLVDEGSMKFTTFQWGGPINSIQTSFVTNVKVMQQQQQQRTAKTAFAHYMLRYPVTTR